MRFYLFILLFIGLGCFVYSQNTLLIRKGSDLFFYDIDSTEYRNIGELKSNVIVDYYYQRYDSFFLYQSAIGQDIFIKHTIDIPKSNLVNTDTVPFHRRPTVAIVKNNQICRNDSILKRKFTRGPHYTFSRMVDAYMIAARSSNLYEIYDDTVKLYKSHYVGSFATYYMNWGYSFPELTKDKKTLYYIDNYTFRYEGKSRLFNRRKDEKSHKRTYSYLIIADTEKKKVKKHIKIPFVHVGTVYQKKYRNLQLSPDDKFLLFEALPFSYLFNTETEEIVQLPKGYRYITWIK